ncbi:MAG: hypothetical protein ABW022_12595 [Actinoplanes sp.]
MDWNAEVVLVNGMMDYATVQMSNGMFNTDQELLDFAEWARDYKRAQTSNNTWEIGNVTVREPRVLFPVVT